MPKPLFKPESSHVLRRRYLRMAACLEQVKYNVLSHLRGGCCDTESKGNTRENGKGDMQGKQCRVAGC